MPDPRPETKPIDCSRPHLRASRFTGSGRSKPSPAFDSGRPTGSIVALAAKGFDHLAHGRLRLMQVERTRRDDPDRSEIASEAETERLGRALAEVVRPGVVIGLVGTLARARPGWSGPSPRPWASTPGRSPARPSC